MITPMKKIITLCLTTFICCIASIWSSVFATNNNFQFPIDASVEIEGTSTEAINLINKLETWFSISGEWGEWIRDLIARVAVKIIIPIFVFAGIILAIIWFYKLMGSDSEEEQKKAFNYLIRWTLGIIIMVSAWFITNQLVWSSWDTNIIWSIWSTANSEAVAGAVVAEQIYNQIVFPLLRIFIYFALGILFILTITHAFKYIFSKDDEFQRKSFTILIYNALWIIVIILAKEMIEIVYGQYSDVINEEVTSGSSTNAGQIGNGVLEISEFWWLQTAINWILSIATFIVLILIVYQSYQLLTNPSSEDLVGNLKKNIVYTLIGILIIGAWYLITNFFIIT